MSEDLRLIANPEVENEASITTFPSSSHQNKSMLYSDLSPSTLESLMEFMSKGSFSTDNTYGIREEIEGDRVDIADSVCVAYTQSDVAVIAATVKRLQVKDDELFAADVGADMCTSGAEQSPKSYYTSHPSLFISELLATSIFTNNIKTIMVNEGVLRYNNVLSIELCDSLLVSINNTLGVSITNNSDFTRDSGFGNVLCREKRWDMYLRDNGACHDVLHNLMSSPNDIIPKLFHHLFDGSDADFHELSALISDPGSASQPIHPDSKYTPTAPMYTVFIALQDIDADMGPTIFLPHSNNQHSHDQLFSNNPYIKDSFLKHAEYRQSNLRKGDMAIMDSRCLHCGDANRSQSRRVLLYLTLRDPHTFDTCSPPIPAGSLWPDMCLKLSTFAQ